MIIWKMDETMAMFEQHVVDVFFVVVYLANPTYNHLFKYTVRNTVIRQAVNAQHLAGNN